MKKENPILDLSFKFSLEIVKFTKNFESLIKYNLAKQLFCSGTSIGANICCAHSAESKADFINKVKVAYKEANETEFWLLLCEHSESYPNCENLLDDGLVLKKVMSKIIGTAKS